MNIPVQWVEVATFVFALLAGVFGCIACNMKGSR